MSNVTKWFEGKHKETLSWKIKRKTLYVYGTGEMPDTNCGNHRAELPWAEQKDSIHHIVIGEGITVIGIRNFEGYEMLESVILPQSMKKIRYRAFCGCEKLKNIKTKNEVVYYHICERKEDLNRQFIKRNFTEKKQVITFGRDAFYKTVWAVENFGEIYLKDGILYDVFTEKSKWVLPEGVTKINKYTFGNKMVSQVEFPESLEVIDIHAFSNTKLRRLELPWNVKRIGYNAFQNCPLEAVIFENEDIMIDRNAFKGTKVFYRYGRSYPAAYELFNKSEKEYGGFKRIEVREKQPEWGKDADGNRYLKKAVFGSRKIDVGRSLARKLWMQSIVVGISYAEGKVRCVKSLCSVGDGLFNEYLMYPCVIGKSSVGIWRDSFTYQEFGDIIEAFPKNSDPEELIKKGKLRTFHPGECEEWFWSNDRGNYGGPLEIELAEKWLKQHKESGERIQSIEENKEEDKTRWFVEL